MNNPTLSRRSLLAALGLGGAALALPFGRGLVKVAKAGPPAAPTRILFVFGMGSIRSFWAPVGVGGKAPTETAWALGQLHGPLAGHEKQLLFLDGLDMTVADLTAQASGENGHQHGGIASLTAAKRQSSSLASAVSIDQLIAQKINSPTPLTKVPSLELSAGCDGGDVEGGPHYLRAGEIVSPERNPKAAFDRVFKGFAAPDDSAAKKAAADALAQKKSVLDYAAAELSLVSPKLSTYDRGKLDAHASAIRDLEARLSLATVPTASCTPPDAAYTGALGTYKGEPLAGFDLDARLVTAAFSCDLTRVASIHLPTHYDLEPVIGYKAGMFGTSDSHDLTHKTNNAGAALWTDTGAMDLVKKVHLEQAKMFAALLDKLAAIPEGEGGATLLDHTAVLWCGQIAEGGHDVQQLPWILAGGASGQIKTGRYVKYDRPAGKGPAHNDLFVALANIMGVPITTFGEPSVCKGALPRLAG